ncbi:hypothetical protein QBC39DRAFT_90190 [Podospora conica]|nr:hypothetical protein QBC39DRAFT_90190 [Schizothecium conicum]
MVVGTIDAHHPFPAPMAITVRTARNGGRASEGIRQSDGDGDGDVDGRRKVRSLRHDGATNCLPPGIQRLEVRDGCQKRRGHGGCRGERRVAQRPEGTRWGLGERARQASWPLICGLTAASFYVSARFVGRGWGGGGGPEGWAPSQVVGKYQSPGKKEGKPSGRRGVGGGGGRGGGEGGVGARHGEPSWANQTPGSPPRVPNPSKVPPWPSHSPHRGALASRQSGWRMATKVVDMHAIPSAGSVLFTVFLLSSSFSLFL